MLSANIDGSEELIFLLIGGMNAPLIYRANKNQGKTRNLFEFGIE